MCGGEGTRLGVDTEKPLLPIDGVAMIDRVLDALADSAIDQVYVAPSSDTPETRTHLDRSCIETPGAGYVDDLDSVLSDDRIRPPVMTVAADLPLLDGGIIDRILAAHDSGSLSVLVPAATKRELGASLDTTVRRAGQCVAPTGVNVVGDGGDATRITDDRRLAVNVNRQRDARIAEHLAGRRNCRPQ